jgi:hypothetical protein
MLNEALQKPPQQLRDELERVEALLVIVRDRLIAARRRGEPPADQIDDALRKINMALSAIVGVEYPSAGVQRKVLEHARDMLRELPPYVNDLR